MRNNVIGKMHEARTGNYTKTALVWHCSSYRSFLVEIIVSRVVEAFVLELQRRYKRAPSLAASWLPLTGGASDIILVKQLTEFSKTTLTNPKSPSGKTAFIPKRKSHFQSDTPSTWCDSLLRTAECKIDR